MARSINFAYEVVSFLSLAGTTQTNKLQMSRFILNLWTRFSLFPRFPRTLKALAQYFPLCSLKIYVLKKFVPSSLPPPRTHFDFITTKCMITTVCSTIDSFINLDQLSLAQRNLLIFKSDAIRKSPPTLRRNCFTRTNPHPTMSSTFFWS